MKYVIVYWSRYGNGKKIINYVGEKLKDKKANVDIFKISEVDPLSIPDADAYIFSAPTEAFSIQRDMKRFLKQLDNMGEKKYALINTHARKNKNSLGKMEKILSKKDMEKIAGIDFQVVEGFREGNGLHPNWKENIDEFVEKL